MSYAEKLAKATRPGKKRGVTLTPHQEAALKKLEKSNAILLYHGLGSGKTISSIAGSRGKTVAVVPASLRENYKKEIRKAGRKPSDYRVVSYEGFTKSPEVSGTLVVDEAHRMGDASTKRTKAILSKSDEFQRKILLTGTPIRNYPHEMAPLIRVLNKGSKIPTDETAFNKRFLEKQRVPVGIWNRLRGIKPGLATTPKNLGELREAVRGRVHYHAAGQEGYPGVSEEVRPVEMSREQAGIYRGVTSRRNPALALKVRLGLPPNKKELKQLNAFMTAARMVSNTGRPYGGKEPYSNKARDVVSQVEKDMRTNKRHKAVIYSNYIEGGVRPISDLLVERGVKHRTFVGGMSDKGRREVVEGFNQDSKSVLLISGAGSEGLDLKGTRKIHIMEPHWNKQRIDQVIGRGVRYKSHEHLPKKERKVSVIHHQSTLPPRLLQRVTGRRDVGADKYLSDLSKNKQKVVDAFLEVLKEEGRR